MTKLEKLKAAADESVAAFDAAYDASDASDASAASAAAYRVADAVVDAYYAELAKLKDKGDD
tara:strand:- start:4388 stop:4573 length:186 start_codon:yes stop_codon:yes gene_type:complete